MVEYESYGDRVVKYLIFSFTTLARGLVTLPEIHYGEDTLRKEKVYHHNSSDLALESKGLRKKVSR